MYSYKKNMHAANANKLFIRKSMSKLEDIKNHLVHMLYPHKQCCTLLVFCRFTAFLALLEAFSAAFSACLTRVASLDAKNCSVNWPYGIPSRLIRGHNPFIPWLNVKMAKFTATLTVAGEENSVLGHLSQIILLKLSFWFCVAPNKHLKKGAVTESNKHRFYIWCQVFWYARFVCWWFLASSNCRIVLTPGLNTSWAKLMLWVAVCWDWVMKHCPHSLFHTI